MDGYLNGSFSPFWSSIFGCDRQFHSIQSSGVAEVAGAKPDDKKKKKNNLTHATVHLRKTNDDARLSM